MVQIYSVSNTHTLLNKMSGSCAGCFHILILTLLSRGEFDLVKKVQELGTIPSSLVYILNNYGHIDLSTVLIESGFDPVRVQKVAKEWKPCEEGDQERVLFLILMPSGRRDGRA